LAAAQLKQDIVQSDLLDLVGYNLKRAYMVIHQDFIEALGDLDLRQRTFSVLSLVATNPGISQSDLARTLGIERSGTVVIVDELENRNLIRRDRVEGDRRSYALNPTEAGKNLYQKAATSIRNHENAILADLGDTAREQLVELLQKIHKI